MSFFHRFQWLSAGKNSCFVVVATAEFSQPTRLNPHKPPANFCFGVAALFRQYRFDFLALPADKLSVSAGAEQSRRQGVFRVWTSSRSQIQFCSTMHDARLFLTSQHSGVLRLSFWPWQTGWGHQRVWPAILYCPSVTTPIVSPQCPVVPSKRGNDVANRASMVEVERMTCVLLVVDCGFRGTMKCVSLLAGENFPAISGNNSVADVSPSPHRTQIHLVNCFASFLKSTSGQLAIFTQQSEKSWKGSLPQSSQLTPTKYDLHLRPKVVKKTLLGAFKHGGIPRTYNVSVFLGEGIIPVTADSRQSACKRMCPYNLPQSLYLRGCLGLVLNLFLSLSLSGENLHVTHTENIWRVSTRTLHTSMLQTKSATLKNRTNGNFLQVLEILFCQKSIIVTSLNSPLKIERNKKFLTTCIRNTGWKKLQSTSTFTFMGACFDFWQIQSPSGSSIFERCVVLHEVSFYSKMITRKYVSFLRLKSVVSIVEPGNSS